MNRNDVKSANQDFVAAAVLMAGVAAPTVVVPALMAAAATGLTVMVRNDKRDAPKRREAMEKYRKSCAESRRLLAENEVRYQESVREFKAKRAAQAEKKSEPTKWERWVAENGGVR